MLYHTKVKSNRLQEEKARETYASNYKCHDY